MGVLSAVSVMSERYEKHAEKLVTRVPETAGKQWVTGARTFARVAVLVV
jgi:hypothetical protein